MLAITIFVSVFQDIVMNHPLQCRCGTIKGFVNNPRSANRAFGPVRAWVNTNGARGNPKPKQVGLGPTALWFIATALKARVNGDYKHTPFFLTDTGTPIVSPRVLSSGELASVMDAVRAAPARS